MRSDRGFDTGFADLLDNLRQTEQEGGAND
jgi:hypothetical protein